MGGHAFTVGVGHFDGIFHSSRPILRNFCGVFHMRGANWPCAALIERLLFSELTSRLARQRRAASKFLPARPLLAPGWLGHERVSAKQPEIVLSQWPQPNPGFASNYTGRAKDRGPGTGYYERTVRTYRFHLSQCGTDMPLRDFGAAARITVDLVCAVLLRRMPSPQI
jgi:hypothetical protein